MAKPLSYALASSSMITTECRKSPPAPPCSSSIHGQRKPASPALRHTSRDTIPSSRHLA
jgi:hypothetical protein